MHHCRAHRYGRVPLTFSGVEGRAGGSATILLLSFCDDLKCHGMQALILSWRKSLKIE